MFPGVILQCPSYCQPIAFYFKIELEICVNENAKYTVNH